jgi:hypothetical protein
MVCDLQQRLFGWTKKAISICEILPKIRVMINLHKKMVNAFGQRGYNKQEMVQKRRWTFEAPLNSYSTPPSAFGNWF